MRLEETYRELRDKADFYLIYIKEAHPTDGRRPSREVQIPQHKSLEERTKAATTCASTLNLTMPLLVDDMKNTVGDAFSGHPDRLFVLAPDGTIAYRGDPGPRGFSVPEMRAALEKALPKD